MLLKYREPKTGTQPPRRAGGAPSGDVGIGGGRGDTALAVTDGRRDAAPVGSAVVDARARLQAEVVGAKMRGADLLVVVLTAAAAAGAGAAGPGECEDDELPCVPKCCPRGQVLMMEDRKCHDSTVTLQVVFENASEPADPASYAVAYGDPCSSGKYLLDPEAEEDWYMLLGDGTLSVPGTQVAPFHSSEFCTEMLVNADGGATPLFFLCFPVSKAEQGSHLHRIFYPLGLLVSVPFLLATVFVYLWIRELRDLHGRTLCCYASCMAVAYVALAVVQLSGTSLGQAPCTVFAYIIQFSFVTCFFWLNTLCIDVCWYILAFTGAINYYPGLPQWQFWDDRGWLRVENETIDRKQEEHFSRKVFCVYAIYACGLPTILLIIVIVLDLNPALPVSYLKPSMGDLVCWFSNEQGALHYFYGPIGCILAINVVLFGITLLRIIRHQWNRRGPHRTPRQRARMCLVLFLAMGISWIMEIISWAVGGPPFVWAVTDAFNVLQGVVIFIIFVMEPRVRILIGKKLSKHRGYFSHY